MHALPHPPSARSSCCSHAGRLSVLPACPLIHRSCFQAQHRARPTVSVRSQGPNHDGGNGPEKSPLEAHVQKLMNAAGKAGDEVARVLTPREAYDTADWVLMILSTLCFIWMAAILYSMYAHMYYSMGFTTIREMMSK